jgi:hypothetical protein
VILRTPKKFLISIWERYFVQTFFIHRKRVEGIIGGDVKIPMEKERANKKRDFKNV